MGRSRHTPGTERSKGGDGWCEAVLDISLDNPALYVGCEVIEVVGRLALITPVVEAVNVVGRNARTVIEELIAVGVEEVSRIGAVAIWA